MSGPARWPFGKYRGLSIDAAPTDYLTWAHSVAKAAWLRKLIAAELAVRGWQVGRDQPQATPARWERRS